MLRRVLTTSAACAWLLAAAQPANAELIVLSATDFVKRCTAECFAQGGDQSVVTRGVLKPDDSGTFFASVPFPVNGHSVCSFALVYHDINANDPLSARLLRKTFKVGSNAFNNPIVMARVTSAPGVQDTARRVATRDIASAKIQKGNSFYYVEVFAETINLNILGVQIDARPTCPAP